MPITIDLARLPDNSSDNDKVVDLLQKFFDILSCGAGVAGFPSGGCEGALLPIVLGAMCNTGVMQCGVTTVLASPANILLTSVSGKSIGTFPNGTQVNEIPGGWYSGSNTEPQVIWLPVLQQNIINATLTGTGSRLVHFGVGTFTSNGFVTNNSTFSISPGLTVRSSVSISDNGITVTQLTVPEFPYTPSMIAALGFVVVIFMLRFIKRRKDDGGF